MYLNLYLIFQCEEFNKIFSINKKYIYIIIIITIIIIFECVR